MEKSVKENILYVLTTLKKMLYSDKIISFELKKLSNHLIEDASLFQDQDSISVAVLVYTLYKIFTKNESFEKKQLIKLLSKAIKSIEIDAEFRNNIREIFNLLNSYEKNLHDNMIEIINHAQAKKGLKIYEHGLSIGQAAEIMNISKWKLMEYLGTSEIINEDPDWRIDNKTRLNFARGLFK